MNDLLLVSRSALLVGGSMREGTTSTYYCRYSLIKVQSLQAFFLIGWFSMSSVCLWLRVLVHGLMFFQISLEAVMAVNVNGFLVSLVSYICFVLGSISA